MQINKLKGKQTNLNTNKQIGDLCWQVEEDLSFAPCVKLTCKQAQQTKKQTNVRFVLKAWKGFVTAHLCQRNMEMIFERTRFYLLVFETDLPPIQSPLQKKLLQFWDSPAFATYVGCEQTVSLVFAGIWLCWWRCRQIRGGGKYSLGKWASLRQWA